MFPQKRLYRTLLLASVFVSALAAAQGSSVITGTVTDAATGKPVPDVVVTATSPAMQGEEIVVTDATGLYRFSSLPPGVYLLRLEKESYKPFSRPDITIRVDRTVRVNIQLQPESVTGDTVVVVGKPPTVDVGSTTTGINVGREFIDNISFIRPTANGIRSFESLAAVAPQVQSDTYGYGFSGTTSPENGVYIDGINSNDPQTGINGAQLPVDFVQEANIITGGYQAEYGRAGGGIINAVTKSGSNEFHGSVWVNYSPGVLTADQKEVAVTGVSQAFKAKNWNVVDFGADVGGPIVKDKLWFYVGIAPSFNRRLNTETIYPLGADGNVSSTPLKEADGSDFAFRQFDDRRAITYIAKLTYNINNDHTLTLAVNGAASDRRTPAPFNGTAFSGITAGMVLPDTNSNLSLKYTGGFFDRKLLVDATFGWFHQTATPYGMPDDGSKIGGSTGSAATPTVILTNAYNLPDVVRMPSDVAAQCTNGAGDYLCPVTSNGQTFTIGGYGFMQQNVNDRIVAAAKVSYLLNALGHHVFKGGLDFERDIYQTTKAYSGGVTARQLGATFYDYRRFGYASGPTVDDVQQIDVVKTTPTTNQLGVFIQDSWSIMDVVTVNAGVRYDNQVLFDGQGNQSMALNNMWSPRVGVIYDPTQQGRSKIFANFSRYYQSMPLNIADRALSGENQIRVDRNATGNCDPVTNPLGYFADCTDVRLRSNNSPLHYATATGQGRTAIDPNLQAQAKDEVVVGGEYEIIPDLRVGASYTKSWMVNIIEDMSNDEATTYFIGNPGSGLASQFPKNGPEGKCDKTSGNNCPWRDYDAVTLHVSKAFSDGWVGQASYTWSYLRGTWAGFYRPEDGQLDPGTNAVYDLKSLLANNFGPLPGDRTHYIKFYGAKNFQVTNAFGLLLGLTYEGYSGAPLSYLGAHGLYGPDSAYILSRGAAGRGPWVHTFNLKAGASYKFSKDLGVAFTVDVLNLFNFQAATAIDQTYTLDAVLPYTPAKGENPQEAICASGANTGPACVSKVTDLDDPHGDGLLHGDSINPNFKQPTQYQQPLQVRFGLKFTF